MTSAPQKSRTKGAYDLAFALSAFALPTTTICPAASKETADTSAVRLVSFESRGKDTEQFQATFTPAKVLVPKIDRPTWTKQDDKRFDELAEKAALEEITEEENAELSTLTSLRRIAQYPADPEEYFAEMLRRHQIRNVLKNLSSCFSLKHGLNWQDY